MKKLKWIIYNSDGNELVTSTDNPFTYTPGGNIIVEAVFEKVLTPGWVGTNVANYQTARTGFTVPADVNVLKWTMNPYGDNVYISVIPGVHYEVYRYSMSNPAQGKPYVQHLEFMQQTGSLKRVIYHKEVTTEAEHDEMILTSPMQFFYSSEINNHATDMKALPYYNTFSVIVEEPMLGGGTTDVEGITKAAQYQDITITATPDIGYTFTDWQITPTGENPQVVIENPYTFTMPAKNVTITPNFNEDIIIDPPVNIPTGAINVPAEGETFTFTVPQNITVLEAITASQGTTVKDYIGVTAGKTYTWSVALTYTPPQPVVRGLWQLKNGSDSVLVQIVKYIGSNLVGSGASVLSYSEAINKISPTITAY